MNLKRYSQQFLVEHNIDIPMCSCCHKELDFDVLLTDFYCANPQCVQVYTEKLQSAYLVLTGENLVSGIPEIDLGSDLSVSVVNALISLNIPSDLSLIHYVQSLCHSECDSLLKLVFKGYKTFFDFYSDFDSSTVFSEQCAFLQQKLGFTDDTAFVYDLIFILCNDLISLRNGLLLLDSYLDVNSLVPVEDVKVVFSFPYSYENEGETVLHSRTVTDYVDVICSDNVSLKDYKVKFDNY